MATSSFIARGICQKDLSFKRQKMLAQSGLNQGGHPQPLGLGLVLVGACQEPGPQQEVSLNVVCLNHPEPSP